MTLHYVKHLGQQQQNEMRVSEQRVQWRGEGLTSFSLPEVKDGERTLRILLHWSSSAIDTASYRGPFRRKFCNRTPNGELKQKLWISETCTKVTVYPAVGEERVALFNKNSFRYGGICDTQHGLPAIINPEEHDETNNRGNENNKWVDGRLYRGSKWNERNRKKERKKHA